MVLCELGVFGITAKHTIITSEEDTNICVRALQRTPLTCRYPISSPTDVVVGYAHYENLHKELDIATFLPLAHNSFPVNMFNASVPYIMNKEMLTKFEYVKDVKVCLHMYVCIVCMYDYEILEFFVCICVENQSVGTLLFYYYLL
jgi:hypothetical protein